MYFALNEPRQRVVRYLIIRLVRSECFVLVSSVIRIGFIVENRGAPSPLGGAIFLF